MMFALDALQRRFQSFNQFSAHRIFDDGESVVAYPVGMGLNLGVRQHLALPKSTIDAFSSREPVPTSLENAMHDAVPRLRRE